MATSKVAGGSDELSVTLAATDRAPWNKGRMDSERLARLSLVDVSTGTAPAPKNSRQSRPSQRRDPELQTPSGLRPDEVTTTISKGPTETTTTGHWLTRRQDNERTSQRTSFSQPPGGGVYLPKPDREGTIVLNPTAPAYQPLGTSSIGNLRVSRYTSGTVFPPYQPVRSVPNFRTVPPWRIDK